MFSGDYFRVKVLKQVKLLKFYLKVFVSIPAGISVITFKTTHDKEVLTWIVVPNSVLL